MDNHASHISIDAIGIAKENGIHLVTFHPHTTHKMQPLDRTVFTPFKTHYNNAVTNIMISSENAEKPITIYHIAELAGMAYTKAFTPSNIINGFKVCGLYPLNPDIFSEEDFLPSSVTDIPLTSEDNNPPMSSQGSLLSTPPKSDCTNLKSVSPFDLMPLPEAGQRTNNKPSCKGKAPIVTEKARKKEIEERKRKKTTCNNESKKRKRQIPQKNKVSKKYKSKTKNTFRLVGSSQCSSKQVFCRVCHNIIQNDDKWIKCIVCRNAVCVKCAGTGILPFEFICKRCLNTNNDHSAADEDNNPTNQSCYKCSSLLKNLLFWINWYHFF